jgi:hypothetical protein
MHLGSVDRNIGGKAPHHPRKSCYDNLEKVSSNGDYEVTFHLKRVQRAFLTNPPFGTKKGLPTGIFYAQGGCPSFPQNRLGGGRSLTLPGLSFSPLGRHFRGKCPGADISRIEKQKMDPKRHPSHSAHEKSDHQLCQRLR